MADKEGSGIKLGLIFAVPFVGVIFYMAAAAGINLLFVYKLIPIEIMGLISKIMLLAVTLVVCSIVKGRVKGDIFINSALAAFLLCAMMLCASVVSNGGKINTAGAVLCVFISSIGCFLIIMKSDKYGKLHKKRRKRK